VTVDVTALQRELSNPEGALRTWLTGFAGTAVGGVVGLGASVVSAMFSALTVGLFTFYLVADGPRFRRTVCSVLPPARQRVFLEVWTIAIDKTGGYLISRLLLAGISAAFHAVAFTWIELPNALVVGIFVGLVSQLVPTVGTYIAGLLPTLVALLDPQPSKALWVLGVVIIYQQVENYFLQPRITASTISIHPAVAFAAVIAGGALQGAIGALLALPAIATLQAILSTYLARHEVMESRLTAVSAGPPPTEARPGGSG
jgi:predicted PurR-regulated permease PerM